MSEAAFRPTASLCRSSPPGCRLYAIGDVHGRLDLLTALLDALQDEIAQCSRHAVLIMLGDYVDRGPCSREVIERLLQLDRDPTLETRFVRGNHDWEMARFARDPAVGPVWCRFGGTETLLSYGLRPPRRADDADAWVELQAAFKATLPGAHLDFLDRLQPYVVYGDYFFTHAGARGGVDLEHQTEQDLMWIRGEFLSDDSAFPKTIVHGHTAQPDVLFSARRIGLDTGAYATGKLTAVVLEDGDRRLLQTRQTAAGITVRAVDAQSV